MYNKLKKSREGFTIIEVMIVLAIAGLIMLIVFLAVPALQRAQRNNARTSDMGRLGVTIQEWVSNHNGDMPDNGQASPTGTNHASSIAVNVGQLAQYKLADSNNFQIISGATELTYTNEANLGKVVLATGAQCDTDLSKAVLSSSSRKMALLYQLEGGGSTPTPICKEL